MKLYMTFGMTTGWFEVIGVRDGVTLIRRVL